MDKQINKLIPQRIKVKNNTVVALKNEIKIEKKISSRTISYDSVVNRGLDFIVGMRQLQRKEPELYKEVVNLIFK